MIDPQIVLSILKAALEGAPADIDAAFPVEEYLSFAKVQQVEALFIAGIHRSGFSYGKAVRNIALRAALVAAKQENATKELCDLFEANGIDYLPLKGCILRSLYPSPELRSMGDIDILIKVEQYKQIRSLLTAHGFCEGYESDHEYAWDKNDVHIELHKRLIPSYNKDYYAYYGDGWQLAKPTEVLHRFAMSPEDTFIFIFTHYAKHYRDVGAGIRQVLDLYVYRKAYPHMDEQYIQETLEQLQLERFYANNMHLLEVWFGNAEHTEASKLISDRLFASGAFGTHEDSLQSVMLKQVNRQGSIRKAKIAKWLRRVFLPLDSMRRLYPVLHKMPILLPALWVHRWMRILLHKRYRFAEYRQEDRTLDEGSVERYHEMLQKSGLDFNFK